MTDNSYLHANYHLNLYDGNRGSLYINMYGQKGMLMGGGSDYKHSLDNFFFFLQQNVLVCLLTK